MITLNLNVDIFLQKNKNFFSDHLIHKKITVYNVAWPETGLCLGSAFTPGAEDVPNHNSSRDS